MLPRGEKREFIFVGSEGSSVLGYVLCLDGVFNFKTFVYINESHHFPLVLKLQKGGNMRQKICKVCIYIFDKGVWNMNLNLINYGYSALRQAGYEDRINEKEISSRLLEHIFGWSRGKAE